MVPLLSPPPPPKGVESICLRSWDPVVFRLPDGSCSSLCDTVDVLVLVTDIGEADRDCSKKEHCNAGGLDVPFVVSDKVFSKVRELLDVLVCV